MRVIYGTLSNLLQYGDPHLAMQSIKHNMGSDDQNNASSPYLYIPNLTEPISSSPRRIPAI
jgi:hypothetical protein